MATIRELVGKVYIAPQYSKKEADLLVEEYHDRTKLEGEAMHLDIKYFGADVVDADLYKDIAVVSLQDYVNENKSRNGHPS